MKKLLMLAVVLILVGVAASAQSSFLTGEWLHDDWPAEQKLTPSAQAMLTWSGSVQNMDFLEMNRASTYQGFVLGASRLMIDLQWIDIPTSVTLEQQCAVVGKYLDSHPDQLNLRAEQLVYWALYAVWPGKKKPQ